ncbi:MAG: NAD(P)-binding protein [Nitrospinaceae bacterium]|nr:NAD(P)/FAD-dependent oxidoreductase [Nitrospinaceae bacterium]NIR53689.1 NAD(P)/FAD-dependent oxidoreductase [Nitrospinaceae bacterium]NIS84100.1 NAD(P)/FAD-dependent oxidoreductase [Nitrospinaceae bacterium]NIT80900.1 NAD(P)/FAD-dependent oxidoreductase [Nitrospinaceae bacterium]NIU44395.1 NAD(P)/FAD-dependent oxidoreductase [Nitrospinaceae bacterium]
MDYEVLIIGSGLSGLAAGIRLALFDKKVCIVEKHVEVGGLNSFYRRKNRILDVGLHALTNYTPKGVRSSPLGKILKQLRFRHEEFRLCPQGFSEIRFPDKSIRFSNDFEFFKQEVAEQFPRQIDGFLKLVESLRSYNDLVLADEKPVSTRQVLARYLSDPLLIEMLLCPTMFYGNAREDDMDFYQFSILFKSLFMEGLAKPVGGMSYLLRLLVDKYKSLGGELRLGAPVEQLNLRDGRVESITLGGGETVRAETVLSSMGWVETLRHCHPAVFPDTEADPGKVSFIESQFILDRDPRDLGIEPSILFYSLEPRFRYREPDGLVDVASGIVCSANNFQYPEPLPDGLVRMTHLASFRRWDALPRKDYRAAKKEWREKGLEGLFTFFPDFRDSVVFLDTFTPKTIQKYTGHVNGAVYGSPRKIKSGTTPVRNLFLCGTDQGFLGIIGATLSGISMANLHCLQKEVASDPNHL